MRILFIAGSPRAASMSRKLARRAMDHAARAHGQHELDWLDLHETRVEAFRGFDEDYEPETRAALDKLVTADALLIASPVYNGGYASAIKNLFEHVPQKSLVDKSAGLCFAGGSERSFVQARSHLASLLAYFFIHLVPRAVYALAEDLEPGVPEDVDARLRRLVDALVRLAEHVPPPEKHGNVRTTMRRG